MSIFVVVGFNEKKFQALAPLAEIRFETFET